VNRKAAAKGKGGILKRLIDLSQIIENNMPVYPGDIGTNLFQMRYLSVNGHNNHRLDTGMHSGTHIDSPMHMTESTRYISDAPVESFIAAGFVIDVRNQPVIEMKAEFEELIKDNGIVLLYTGWDEFYGTAKYYESHPILDIDFCKFLIRKKTKMVGMDIPSPDRFPFEIHKLFFGKGIFVIENLTNLDKLLGVENFEVMAFPLKIKADSSVARVVARILSP
jgi:kynurenine formamidase